jgi:NADH-quinone oxidoreductase subunit G
MAPERAPVLYSQDAGMELRFSHENPSITKIYEDYFGKPLSEKSHHLLHTNHHAWKMPNEK